MLKMMTETGAALALPINDSFRSWRRGRDGAEGVDEYLKVRACVRACALTCSSNVCCCG